MKTIKPTNRRNFLLAAGLGSAGVAAAAATGVKPGPREEVASAADKPGGYHVSEHILKYYNTTKV